MGGWKSRKTTTFATFNRRTEEARHRKQSAAKEMEKRARRENSIARGRLSKASKLFSKVKPVTVERIHEIFAEAKRKRIQLANPNEIVFKFRSPGKAPRPYLPSHGLTVRTTYYAKLLGVDQAVFELTGKHVFSRLRRNYYSYAFTFVKRSLLKSKSKALQGKSDDIQDVFENEKMGFKKVLLPLLEK